MDSSLLFLVINLIRYDILLRRDPHGLLHVGSLTAHSKGL